MENISSSQSTAKELENNPILPSNQIIYTGSGRSFSPIKSKKGPASLKKSAPIMLLLGMIVVIGIGIAFVQSLAPFSFLENAKNMFNTTRTGYSMSATTLMNSYLTGSATAAEDDPAPDNIYDDLELPQDMQSRLESGGLYYTTVGGVKGLLYEDPSSKEWSLITSDSVDASSLVGQTVSSTPSEDESDDTLDSSSSDPIIISQVSTLDDAYATDGDFANALDIGLRSWESHSAGWYNSTAEMYTTQIGNTRDKFSNIGQATPTIEEYDSDIKNNGAKVEISNTSGNVQYADCIKIEEKEKRPEHCNTQDTGNDSLNPSMDEEAVAKSLSSRAKKAMTAGEAQPATNECKVAKAVAATSAAATGVLKIQTMNSGSAFLETVDKTKVGDGGGAMNAAMIKYSTPGETLALNDDSDWVPVEGKENSSAVGSVAWSYVAGGGPALSSDDPLVKTFLQESLITDPAQSSKISEATVYNSENYYTTESVSKCSSITDYENAENTYQNVGSAPAGGLFSSIINSIVKFFSGEENFVNAQSDAIAQAEAKRTKAYLDMDLESMTGETSMYGIVSGVESYYQGMQVAVSARPATEENLQAFWRDTQAVIAKEAQVERSILSPFDITSQNTFLGSIVHKALPTISKINTPLKAFSSFLGSTMSSLNSIIPIAGAASAENEYKQSIREDCQTFKYLESVNGQMAGNAFCFQKAYQDTSTTKTSLRDVYRQIIYGASSEYKDIPNFTGTDGNGNPKVNPKGEYAIWLVACSARKSQWGYQNGQAASFRQEQLDGQNVAATTSGAIEKGLEAQQIEEIKEFNVVYNRNNIDWSTGLNCMGGRDGSLSDQVALYAQYNTYQNLLESAGSVTKATQTAFLENYYTNHPYYTDSIEGIIAEYSGLTPDDVELALGVVEYYDYIAHYDPSDLGPTPPLPETPLFFESTTIIADAPTAPTIISAESPDLRNRTLIV